MRIAEPRNKRLIYFVIYTLLGVLGGMSAFKPSAQTEELLGGMTLIYGFGGLIVAGSLLCMISVLPGIWVLERAGMVGCGTGILMYVTTLILLGARPAIVIFPIIIILVFFLRWLDIKDYLLAPRKG
jgi:hypothetical protein